MVGECRQLVLKYHCRFDIRWREEFNGTELYGNCPVTTYIIL